MNLTQIKREPSADLIKELENLLSDAKEGKIISIAYIAGKQDTTYHYGHIAIQSRFELYGQLNFIADRVLHDELGGKCSND